jgi:ATP-dependent DNA ligase
LKIKCTERQEFVVVGYITSSANSRAIGALVLTYYAGGTLAHAGRVSTGFTAAKARELWAGRCYSRCAVKRLLSPRIFPAFIARA